MAKQIEEKVDKSIIYTSFDKSEKERWLYSIASGKTDHKMIPKKSTLMKMALEFYLDYLGITFKPQSVSETITEKINNSSKIIENKVEVIEKPKIIQEDIKEDGPIIEDDEPNVLGES